MMIIVSYDIADDKLRTNFSKYLLRFGHRIQYSVYEIDNSPRVLKNILADIENRYKKLFGQMDSVYIFNMSTSCDIIRYGYARNENKSLVILQ